MDTPEYAFPIVLETPNSWHHEMGITVRDYFAARALQAMLSMPESYPVIAREGAEGQKKVARSAYGWADLMMEARKP